MKSFWEGIAMNPFLHFVVTGGPCGGKTTGIALLKERLEILGYKVLVVTEAATSLFATGMRPFGKKRTASYLGWNLQSDILADTIRIENRLRKFARRWYAHYGQRVIILSDRGILDGQAYLPRKDFEAILRKAKISFASIYNRYDGVFCLQTAAIGTSAYTIANNSARTETADEAILKDKKTYTAWQGAPHFTYIENWGLTFEEKLARLFDAMCRVIGFPDVIEEEQKFLVEIQPEDLPHTYRSAGIMQRYLFAPPGEERRVRSALWLPDRSMSYFATSKRKSNGRSVRIETESVIDGDSFNQLLRDVDPMRGWVKKQRKFFLSGAGVYELDQFPKESRIHQLLGEHGGNGLGEFEFRFQGCDLPPLPRGVRRIRDVTNVPEFSNAQLAYLCAA